MTNEIMIGKLHLQDGTTLEGESFGAQTSRAGEVVFSTGMVGYPEGITDPSYQGQILTLTYPLIGNYGVPDPSFFESSGIKVSGLIVSNYNETPSHFGSLRTLSQWLQDEDIPALEVKNTRNLTEKLRDEGSMLGKIVFGNDIPYYDPNKENLVAQVSIKNILMLKSFSNPAKSKNYRLCRLWWEEKHDSVHATTRCKCHHGSLGL